MARREELEQWTVAGLMAYCKDHGIQCYHGKNRMRKSELVAAILQAESVEDNRNGTSAVDANKIGNDAEVERAANENGAAASAPVIDMAHKMPYIENAQPGTLVAFRLSNGKVKSAKVVKKSTKNRRFMLETEYGAQHIVSYDDIVWVRTTKRWPAGVYRLLKGLSGDGQASNGQ